MHASASKPHSARGLRAQREIVPDDMTG